MHPAYSVIIFTTSSGAGYGLLFWIALATGLGHADHTSWGYLGSLTLALALVSFGLISSMVHLGRPERAWRAFSQWRTSWLSREGIVAILTYIPSGLLWLMSLARIETPTLPVLSVLIAMGAVATVWCTGMIYASLRTIRQWNLRLVPVIYLALSAASGGVLFVLLRAATGAYEGWEATLALAFLVLAFFLKAIYFRRIDRNVGDYTASMALGGLGADGVRPLDPPHTQPNFVMREMGYAIARHHAFKLRWIAFGALFAFPSLALALPVITGVVSTIASGIALISMACGLFVERWLFFAEAEHASMLYYGKQRA